MFPVMNRKARFPVTDVIYNLYCMLPVMKRRYERDETFEMILAIRKLFIKKKGKPPSSSLLPFRELLK
jgi:hypothetical protein